MDITIADIRRVRKHRRYAWHDQTWWKFERQKKTDAITFALSQRQPGDTDSDVAREAERYYSVVHGA